VHINEDVWYANDREDALRSRVASALRRHRAFTVFTQLCERGAGKVSLTSYATELPSAFPAVAVADKTWLSYARVFVWWFEYAGLARLDGQLVSATAEGDNTGRYRIFDTRPPIRVRGAFPQEAPGPAIDAILALSAGKATQLHTKRRAGTLRQLIGLGIVQQDGPDSVRLIRADLIQNGQVVPAVLREILEEQPGLSTAFAILEANPAEEPERVGEAIRAAYGADWSSATVHWIGKHVRAWARYAGIVTSLRRGRSMSTSHGYKELQLFSDEI
jgi:hypothetical protein